MEDTYRVLPHRGVGRSRGGTLIHKPCGMDLDEGEVVDANWCPHCAVVINKSAQKRRQHHIQMISIGWNEEWK